MTQQTSIRTKLLVCFGFVACLGRDVRRYVFPIHYPAPPDPNAR
jgi:hypothetical protein